MHRKSVQAIAVAVLFAAFWLVIGSLPLEMALRNDFLCMYTGLKIVADGQLNQLYDLAHVEQVQKAIAPNAPHFIPFVRVPLYAVVLAPLAWLPYKTAFTVWLVLQCLMLAGCWIWAYRRLGPDALALSAMMLAPPIGIAHGQDCVFLLVLMIASYEAFRTGREVLCGILLALCLFKFHLFVLLPLAMLFAKERRILAGFAATGAAGGAVCFALVGSTGMSKYFYLLTRYKEFATFTPDPSLMPNMKALLLNFGILSTPLMAGLLAISTTLALLAATKLPWWPAAGAAIAGSLLITPHAFGYDFTVLAVPALAVAVDMRVLQRTTAWLLTPLPHILVVLGSPWSAATSLSLCVWIFGLAVIAARTGINPAPAHHRAAAASV